MNIFYATPDQIRGDTMILEGQEAVHASKALRYKQGDSIVVVDGEGGWYNGHIQSISSHRIGITVTKKEYKEKPQPEIILAIGIIKKRDRLEFAVEKAVELGVGEIALFRGEHTVKQRIREDRLQSIGLSAMKQSLRSWRPAIRLYSTLQEVVEAHENCTIWTAHEKETCLLSPAVDIEADASHLLVVGPEGGLSDKEIDYLKAQKGKLISLGSHRLRTETAAVSFLSIFRQFMP